MSAAQNAETFKLRILSSSGKLYEGAAVSVTANNKVGPFDILAGHANFFSLLTESTIIVKDGGMGASFSITKGLVKAKANVVTVFVDI